MPLGYHKNPITMVDFKIEGIESNSATMDGSYSQPPSPSQSTLPTEPCSSMDSSLNGKGLLMDSGEKLLSEERLEMSSVVERQEQGRGEDILMEGDAVRPVDALIGTQDSLKEDQANLSKSNGEAEVMKPIKGEPEDAFAPNKRQKLEPTDIGPVVSQDSPKQLNETQEANNSVCTTLQKVLPATKREEMTSKRRRGRPRLSVPTAAASRARRTTTQIHLDESSQTMSAAAATYLAPKPAVLPSQPLITPSIPGTPTIPLPNVIPSPRRDAAQYPALEIFNRPPSPTFRLALTGAVIHHSPDSQAPNTPSSSHLVPPQPTSNGARPLRSTRRNQSIPSGTASAPGTDNPFLDEPSSAGATNANSEDAQSTLRATTPSDAGPSDSQRMVNLTKLSDLTGSPSSIKTTKTKKGKGKASVGGLNVSGGIPNEDICSTCKGIGRFLCCDGCPKSFHFYCLDPPLDINELPAEEEWFCKECRAKKKMINMRAPEYRGLFGPLLKSVDTSNPTQFELPKEIRTYFAGITTRPDGAYTDGFDPKAVKFDRSGFPEDRDATRLKNKGKVILCQKCQMSAAPHGAGVAQGLRPGRRMLSCDYCSESWHLDCLDPPQINMPHPQRKWMCPNHAQQVAPSRRTVRLGIQEVIVDRPGQRNNGNIEILDDAVMQKDIEFKTLYINSKRYKVPEKVIHLDFWTKIGRRNDSQQASSSLRVPTMEEVFGGGSPLSAPPSLTPSEAVDDNEDVDIPSGPQSPRLSPPMVFTDEDEEMTAARLLLGIAGRSGTVERIQNPTRNGPMPPRHTSVDHDMPLVDSDAKEKEQPTTTIKLTMPNPTGSETATDPDLTDKHTQVSNGIDVPAKKMANGVTVTSTPAKLTFAMSKQPLTSGDEPEAHRVATQAQSFSDETAMVSAPVDDSTVVASDNILSLVTAKSNDSEPPKDAGLENGLNE